jgi:hypothetical protein
VIATGIAAYLTSHCGREYKAVVPGSEFSHQGGSCSSSGEGPHTQSEVFINKKEAFAMHRAVVALSTAVLLIVVTAGVYFHASKVSMRAAAGEQQRGIVSGQVRAGDTGENRVANESVLGSAKPLSRDAAAKHSSEVAVGHRRDNGPRLVKTSLQAPTGQGYSDSGDYVGTASRQEDVSERWIPNSRLVIKGISFSNMNEQGCGTGQTACGQNSQGQQLCCPTDRPLCCGQGKCCAAGKPWACPYLGKCFATEEELQAQCGEHTVMHCR